MIRLKRKPQYPKEEYENFEMPSDDMDTDIRGWSSKLVMARKKTQCSYCGAEIEKYDYCLAEKGFVDNMPFYVHNCLDCVEETMKMQNGEMDADDALHEWEKRAKASGYTD